MIFTSAFILQIAALFMQMFFLLVRVSRRDNISRWLLAGSACLLFAGFIRRSVLIRFFAITNTYESLVFFSLCISILLVLFETMRSGGIPRGLKFGGTFVSIVMLALASSPIAPAAMHPPIPALQSHWLVLHVSFAFIGEAFFAVAFVASVLFLASKSEEKKRELDRLTYTAVALGYPVFTAGALVFGAIWGSYAWGRFWGWDPKETWALVTWLTYTGYLHARFVFKKRRKTASEAGSSGNTPKISSVPAWIAIAGFAFALFTFFGVNFLLKGLHSYG